MCNIIWQYIRHCIEKVFLYKSIYISFWGQSLIVAFKIIIVILRSIMVGRKRPYAVPLRRKTRAGYCSRLHQPYMFIYGILRPAQTFTVKARRLRPTLITIKMEFSQKTTLKGLYGHYPFTVLFCRFHCIYRVLILPQKRTSSVILQ
jgi:hypothetical protein